MIILSFISNVVDYEYFNLKIKDINLIKFFILVKKTSGSCIYKIYCIK